MSDYVFPPGPPAAVEVANSAARYPVRRIFCVGRNYAAHAAEMGNEVDREAPFYFTKSPAALAPSGAALPYAPGTQDLHHEMELVVALGAPLFRAGQEEAAAAVYAYGAGLDMTRRDLQQQGKDKRRPWDLGKDFEHAAVLGPLQPRAEGDAPLGPRRIALSVDGALRQEARLADMVWSVPEILSHLSGYYHLGPGDLVMTGTPAGVGPVLPGNRLEGRIDGLPAVTATIGAPE